jgi:hypothetical protein
MLKTLALLVFLAPSLASAEECPWLPSSRIDHAYPDRAPWSTMIGGEGRCKFISDQSKPASVLSLTQIIKASPQEAEAYVKSVASGMAKSYNVTPAPALGKNGAAVRQKEASAHTMLTLIGHQKNVVVMAQLSFYGEITEAQQQQAQELTKETFTLNTGGGLKMPSN